MLRPACSTSVQLAEALAFFALVHKEAGGRFGSRTSQHKGLPAFFPRVTDKHSWKYVLICLGSRQEHCDRIRSDPLVLEHCALWKVCVNNKMHPFICERSMCLHIWLQSGPALSAKSVPRLLLTSSGGRTPELLEDYVF